MDTETTGLEGHPIDRVLEIGIAEYNEDTGDITPLYSEVIRYDDIESFDSRYVNSDGSKGIWVYRHSDLRIEDTLNAEKDIDTVVREVREMVNGRDATSYNIAFDFFRFLMTDPWFIRCRIPMDIMDLATERVYELADSDSVSDKILQRKLLKKREDHPHDSKWVSATDAYRVLCPDDPMGKGKRMHRALDDAVMEGWILRALSAQNSK